MGRRMTNAQASLMGFVILVAALIGIGWWVIHSVVDSLGWLPFICLGVVVIAALILGVVLKNISKRQRHEFLCKKYQSKEVADQIVKRMFWQGQSAEQLMESLGRPLDVDVVVLKTKKKEIWKYNRTARNAFALKITLEDDIVVGWDQR